MRFTISQSSLARAMQVVAKTISNNATVPILSGVLVEAADGTIVLSTTDGSSSSRVRVPANVEEDGRTVLSCKTLLSAVKGFPDAAVSFDLSGQSCRISCGRSTLTLRTLSPKDFPGFPEVVPSQTIELPSDLLATMVDKVHKVVGRDASRPILSGVLLTVGDGMLRLVATDSYRLAVCDTEVKTEGSFEAIVPGAAIHQVMSLQTMTEAVSIGTSDNQVIFSFGSTTYVTRRLAGDFPNYRMLLPKGHSTTVAFEADDMANALRRAGVVATTNPSVRLDVDDDSMVISASSPDQGESTETIQAQTDGQAMRISLNYHYVLDGVDSMDGEVCLEMQGPMQPAVFKCYGDINYLYLLMPVRS